MIKSLIWRKRGKHNVSTLKIKKKSKNYSNKISNSKKNGQIIQTNNQMKKFKLMMLMKMMKESEKCKKYLKIQKQIQISNPSKPKSNRMRSKT